MGLLSLHLTDVLGETGATDGGHDSGAGAASGEAHSQARQKEHSARQDAERLRLQANLLLENRSISSQYADAAELAKAGEKLLSAKEPSCR